MGDGISANMSKNFEFCESCADGKNHRTPFKSDSSKKKVPFEVIHSDVCSKINAELKGGNKYFFYID